MPEALPGHRSRSPVRLVLVLLGLLAPAGPADASTCHVPERPTFGMDDVPIGHRWAPTLAPEVTAPAPVHYDRVPCPGEPAGFPSKLQVPRASLSTPPRLAPTLPVEPRSVEVPGLRRPLVRPNPPERPPRNLPTLPSGLSPCIELLPI